MVEVQRISFTFIEKRVDRELTVSDYGS